MRPSIDEVWRRIEREAGNPFHTVTGLEFTYEVPGNYICPSRTVRRLSKSNFEKALAAMPAASPAQIRERQGASYTFAILMDPRIRRGGW